MKKKILIVCYGNIHRSSIAEVCIKKQIEKNHLEDKIECESCGIQGSNGIAEPRYPNLTYYKKQYKLMKPMLEKLSIDVTKHTSRPINPILIQQADIIIVMDEKTMKGPHGVLQQYPTQENKTILFSSLYNSDKKDIQDIADITDKKLLENTIEEISIGVQKGFPQIMSVLYNI